MHPQRQIGKHSEHSLVILILLYFNKTLNSDVCYTAHQQVHHVTLLKASWVCCYKIVKQVSHAINQTNTLIMGHQAS